MDSCNKLKGQDKLVLADSKENGQLISHYIFK